MLVFTGRKSALLESEETASPSFALGVGATLIIFTLINTVYLSPQTDFMRPVGDPRQPPAQTLTGITFDNRVTLVGYDLSAAQAHPNETLTMTLYWLLEQPVDMLPHVSLQVIDPVTGQVWVSAESAGLAGQNPQNWTVGKYATETLTLSITSDAPPYVGDLRLSLYDVEGELHYWPTTDGASYAVIMPIRILGDVKDDLLLLPTRIVWGNSLLLQGYAFSQQTAQTCLTLRWFVEKQPTTDLAVMLHLLDAKGQMVMAADGAPLDNRYRTSLWQQGQTLDDTHCFAVPPDAKTLAIGWYTQADIIPLAVTSGEGSIENNALLIPLKAD
jgi:hypothetical protein